MISVHILHTLVRTFSWLLTRRICLLVHKNSKKELGQRPAILTSCLVNNACYISGTQVMRVKKKPQSGEYQLIQYQIHQSNIIRIVWQAVKRITNKCQ